MYSEVAKELRHCTGHNKDGSPCRAWALWNAPDQKCRRHSSYAYAAGRIPAKVCRCDAYAWPHRPGSGLCRWPEVPTQRHKILASTHKYPRRSKWRKAKTFSFNSDRDPIELLERWLHESSNQG